MSMQSVLLALLLGGPGSGNYGHGGRPGEVGGSGSSSSGQSFPEGVEAARATRDVPSEPGYVYHATNVERAEEIAQSGLKTHGPSAHTDQDTWPDGSTEKRNYFTRNAGVAWQFAPEEGKSVILRVKETDHEFRREVTGDMYSRKAVSSSKIEILGTDGAWYSLLGKR